MLSRSFATSLPLLLLGSLLVAACGTPPAPPPKVAAPEPARPSASAARWRTVPVPPREDAKNPTFSVPGGRLVVDASGGRWLFSVGVGEAAKQTAPQWREAIDEGALSMRYFEPKLGFLALAADGTLLGSTDPLGALRPIASLPKGTKPSTLRFFRGGITYFGDVGPELVGTDGARRPVRTMPGYVLAEALLGADGVGVGLFHPEAVALTKDSGATWTRLDTAGVRVTSIRVQNDAPLLVPGGVRDGFPRSVDLDNGKLVRVVEELTPDQRRERNERRRRRGEWEGGFGYGPTFELLGGGPIAPWDHARLSPQLALSGRRGGAAVGDGDRVIDFHPDPTNPSRVLMTRGRIGEALEAYGGDALGECVMLAAAICGDRAAVLCGEKLHLFRGNETVVTRAVPLGTQIGFDQEGQLVSAVDDEESRTVSLRRWSEDFTAGPPESVPGLTRGPLSFLGGCGGPAFWIEGSGFATRWSKTLRAFEPPVNVPADARALAVSHDGSLVASNGADLLFFPAETVAPIGLHQPGYVSFTRSGRHALYVAPSGQVQQSDDGGRTFSPIATPAVRGRLPVLCGDERCQLGSGAWREGFARDPEPIAAWPEQASGPRAGSRDRPPPPPPPTGASMVCRADATLFEDLTGGPIVPRVGGWLAAGVSLDEKGVTAFFADPGGKGTETRLSRVRSITNGDIGLGPALMATSTWGINRQKVSALYRWEPAGPAVRIDPYADGRVTYLAEEGLATVDYQRGDLIHWGKQKPSRRAFSAPSRGGSGILHVEPDGSWLVAEHVERGELRLITLPEGGRSEDRTVTLSGRDISEQAVGFLPGPERKIVLLEATEDGGSELRVRSVSATLGLGDPRSVPGTRAAKGRLLDLPTCAPGAKGAFVYASSTEPRGVQLDKHRVLRNVSRILRVNEASACVERTFLPANGEPFQADLVVAGNGGIALSADAPGGFRCGPLDTTPPPAAPPPPPAE